MPQNRSQAFWENYVLTIRKDYFPRMIKKSVYSLLCQIQNFLTVSFYNHIKYFCPFFSNWIIYQIR